MDETLQHSEDCRTEIEELRSQLREARETLDAIRNGEVDALAVSTPEGEKVFTLQGADHPYRVFVDQMGDGAVTLEERGTILYCNARFAQMLGRPIEELFGASFYDIAVPPECHAVIDNLIARCVVIGGDRPVAGEVRLRPVRGPAIPVNLSLNRIEAGGSHTLCMVVTDLTEQKLTYEFRTLAENSLDAIIRLDRGLRYTYANPAVERLAGRPPAFYLGRALRETTSLFNVNMIEESARRSFETGETITGEVQTLPPGKERYYSVTCVPERGPDGNVHSLLVTLHDITSRRLAEVKAKENSERFALLSRTASELLQSHEPQKMVESLCRKVMERLDCHAFINFLVDQRAGKLHLNACAGISEEEAKKIEWLDYGVAVCGCAARDGCRIVAERIPSTPDPRTELVKSYGIKAYACHPLLTEGGAVIGTLSFGTKTRETFSEEDLALMKAVTDQVSTAVSRMKTEQALRDSEMRLRLATEAAGMYTWELDVATGKIGFSGDVKGIIGFSYTESDDIFSRIGRYVIPEDGDRHREALQRTMRGEGDLHAINRVVNPGTGEIIWLETHATLLRADGIPLRVVGIARNITERKKAEDALRESEERFRAVLDSSLDAAYRRDLRTDRYDYMSPVIEQVSGYTPEEFDGFGIEDVLARVHPDDRDRMNAELEKIMTSSSSGLIEYRFKGKDGRYRWFSDHLRVIRDDDGRPLYRVGIVRDITERKMIVEALAESEKRYRELVNFAPAGICEVDFRNRRFTSVNDSTCEMLGYTREELLTRGPFDILDDKSQILLQERTQRWLNGQMPDDSVEYTCRTKDGRERRVLLNVTFVSDETGRPSGSTIIGQDITERRMMEEQLRRKEEEVRTLIEHSPDIIFRLDTGQRYIFMNSAIERHLGIPAGSFIGNTFEQMGYDVEALALFHRQYEDVLATGREQTIEFTLPIHGETKYFFSRLIPERKSDGAIASLLGITSDITEVKRKEQQLIALNELYRKAKEEYQRLIDTANSIILRWSPDGTLKFVNDYGLEFFGYSKKELMGKNVQFLLPGTDSSGNDLSDLVMKITREPEKYSYSENENVKKNGERAWVMWTNKAIHDEQGNLKEILAIGNDITALKKTQEELRQHKEALETLVDKRTQELLKTHAELERTQRMADIGRLASTIAHELRNPLSGIKAAAYNIQRKSDVAVLGKHIETINKKVQESDLIINNLLGFTRIKTLLHEPLKLPDVVRDCIAAVSAKYVNWNVTVTEDYRCGQGDVIEADFTQMRMLISNLLDNAFQALRDKAGTVHVAVAREGMHYRIGIGDDGIGIAEDEREKIFEPFYTTKSKGTGLGLTVCREIVDLHGGKIDISSAPGKGTVFTVTLPATQPFLHGDGQAVSQPGVVN